MADDRIGALLELLAWAAVDVRTTVRLRPFTEDGSVAAALRSGYARMNGDILEISEAGLERLGRLDRGWFADPPCGQITETDEP